MTCSYRNICQIDLSGFGAFLRNSTSSKSSLGDVDNIVQQRDADVTTDLDADLTTDLEAEVTSDLDADLTTDLDVDLTTDLDAN